MKPQYNYKWPNRLPHTHTNVMSHSQKPLPTLHWVQHNYYILSPKINITKYLSVYKHTKENTIDSTPIPTTLTVLNWKLLIGWCRRFFFIFIFTLVVSYVCEYITRLNKIKNLSNLQKKVYILTYPYIRYIQHTYPFLCYTAEWKHSFSFLLYKCICS